LRYREAEPFTWDLSRHRGDTTEAERTTGTIFHARPRYYCSFKVIPDDLSERFPGASAFQLVSRMPPTVFEHTWKVDVRSRRGKDEKTNDSRDYTSKGGSKGIPKKNITMVGGRPLIAWTICHAKDSKKVDAVYVSTDDEEIARISREWGLMHNKTA